MTQFAPRILIILADSRNIKRYLFRIFIFLILSALVVSAAPKDPPHISFNVSINPQIIEKNETKSVNIIYEIKNVCRSNFKCDKSTAITLHQTYNKEFFHALSRNDIEVDCSNNIYTTIRSMNNKLYIYCCQLNSNDVLKVAVKLNIDSTQQKGDKKYQHILDMNADKNGIYRDDNKIIPIEGNYTDKINLTIQDQPKEPNPSPSPSPSPQPEPETDIKFSIIYYTISIFYFLLLYMACKPDDSPFFRDFFDVIIFVTIFSIPLIIIIFDLLTFDLVFIITLLSISITSFSIVGFIRGFNKNLPASLVKSSSIFYSIIILVAIFIRVTSIDIPISLINNLCISPSIFFIFSLISSTRQPNA